MRRERERYFGIADCLGLIVAASAGCAREMMRRGEILYGARRGEAREPRDAGCISVIVVVLFGVGTEEWVFCEGN